jgi:hemerythrin superfamily protein
MTSEAQEAREHRQQADELPDGDVVGIILRHHADITDAMERIKAARGDSRVGGWEALTRMLKAHETAEQKVVRPFVEDTANPGEAQARNAEEQEADRAIMELNELGADSPEFGPKFGEFASKVHEHAEHEEQNELPLLMQLSAEQRLEIGGMFLAAFRAAS